MIGELAKQIAAKKDRATQAAILDSVTKLERLAEPTAQDARQLAQNPNNPALKQRLAKEVQDMKDLVDKIIADTDAELFAEALKQRNSLASLLNALDEGDRGGLANATKEVAKRQANITPLARASAKKTEDPMRKKNMLDDISELDRLLPNVVSNTNKVLANPRDSQATQRLRESVNIMNGLLSGLADPKVNFLFLFSMKYNDCNEIENNALLVIAMMTMMNFFSQVIIMVMMTILTLIKNCSVTIQIFQEKEDNQTHKILPISDLKSCLLPN